MKIAIILAWSGLMAAKKWPATKTAQSLVFSFEPLLATQFRFTVVRWRAFLKFLLLEHLSEQL